MYHSNENEVVEVVAPSELMLVGKHEEMRGGRKRRVV